MKEQQMLSGMYAAVTGGAKGLGLEIVLALSSQGASVAILDINETEEAVDRALAAGSPAPIGGRLDVSDHASVERSIGEVFPRLDILVNNAGIREIDHSLDITPETWNKVLATNLSGTFWPSQVAARRMKASGGGSIINIASVAGRLGIPSRPAYCASKHGVVGVTRQMAADLGAFGIRVNCVCPGMLRTELTSAYVDDPELRSQLPSLVPIGRPGLPTEVANVVTFLAGPQSSYVHGAVIEVDGGFTTTGTFDPAGKSNYA